MSLDKEALEIKLKASVFKASPTKIAVTSSYFLCKVWKPLLKSALSIAGKSSWIKGMYVKTLFLKLLA